LIGIRQQGNWASVVLHADVFLTHSIYRNEPVFCVTLYIPIESDNRYRCANQIEPKLCFLVGPSLVSNKSTVH